jgi:hypothetical protein
MWKARLGCDAGEGVGRSQSVIVVRDDLGVLEIFANQFESKAETAHKICGLAQKWQIGDWMGPPTLRYQGLDGATHSPVPRKCGWPLATPPFRTRPDIRIISRGQGPAWYTKESEHAGSFRPWQDRGRSHDAGDHCAE